MDEIKFNTADCLSLIKGLSKKDAQAICSSSHIAHYKKGTLLNQFSEDISSPFIISNGCLDIFTMSEEGKEFFLSSIEKNKLCMLFDKQFKTIMNFDIHMLAKTDTDVFIINEDIFNKLISDKAEIEAFAYKSFSESLAGIIYTSQQMLLQSVEKRIASFLLSESDKNGINTVFATHEQIAKYTGSAREVVTRTLSRFSICSIVSLQRGKIVINNKEQLKHIGE